MVDRARFHYVSREVAGQECSNESHLQEENVLEEEVELYGLQEF